MKKTTILLIGILLISMTNTNVFAQKAFKGILTYTIDYSGEIEPAAKAQQPNEMTLMLLDNKSKMEIMQGGGVVIIGQIVNGNDGSAISLINIEQMGMKFYVKTTKEQIEAEAAENDPPKVNLTEETKEICGIEATKAEYITFDEYGDEVTTIVWFSSALGSETLNSAGQFAGLPGIPLEYSMTIDEITTTFTVTDIQKGKVKKADFLIPSDYEEKTQEELEQMFGGE